LSHGARETIEEKAATAAKATRPFLYHRHHQRVGDEFTLIPIRESAPFLIISSAPALLSISLS